MGVLSPRSARKFSPATLFRPRSGTLRCLPALTTLLCAAWRRRRKIATPRERRWRPLYFLWRAGLPFRRPLRRPFPGGRAPVGRGVVSHFRVPPTPAPITSFAAPKAPEDLLGYPATESTIASAE